MLNLSLRNRLFGVLLLLDNPNSTADNGTSAHDSSDLIETLAYMVTSALSNLCYIDDLKRQEKQRLAEQIQFQGLLGHLNDVLWHANVDGTELTDINNNFMHFFGHHVKEFQEDPELWFAFIHEEDRELARRSSDDLMTKGRSSCEYRVVASDGRVRWFHDRKSLLYDEQGQPMQIGGVATEITGLKEMESQLEQLNKTKDQFFSMIAHDLRSPFNSILGLLEVLIQGDGNIDEKDRHEMLLSAMLASRKAYELVDDLLEWGRIQTGNMLVKPLSTDLRSLADDIILLYTATARDKSIQLFNEVDEGCRVTVDIHSIRTILRNLIANAIKFTDDGGEVHISSECSGEVYMIRVSDTGVGIPPDLVKNLFLLRKPVSRPGTRMERGTGLGLIICGDLATRNGWDISVVSEPGEGTTFTLMLRDGASGEELQSSV